MKARFFVTGLAVTLWSSWAWTAPGDASLAFLKIPVDARAVGMGETQIGLPRGPSALYWNPGGLPDIPSWGVTLMHNVWLLETYHDYAAGAVPFEKIGTFAGSIKYFNSGILEGIDPKGLPLGDFTVQDFAGTVGYGRSFLDNTLGTGLSVNLLHEQNEDESGTTAAVNLGILYRTPFRSLSVGLIARNLGAALTLVDEEESLPMIFGVGAGYPIPVSFPFNVGIDVFYGTASTVQFSVGAESVFWKEMVSARLGYKYGYNMEGFSGLRGGVGFHYKWVAVDYALAPFGELGLSHFFSLSLSGQ